MFVRAEFFFIRAQYVRHNMLIIHLEIGIMTYDTLKYSSFKKDHTVYLGVLGIWPAILINPVDTYFWAKTFFGSQEHLFVQFFIFDQGSPIFTLVVVAVFPKTSFIAPIDAEAESSKATTKRHAN